MVKHEEDLDVTKEFVRIGYNRFLFQHSYSGDGLGTMHLGRHLSTHADKKPVISNTHDFDVIDLSIM
jgi:hypothetical protein